MKQLLLLVLFSQCFAILRSQQIVSSIAGDGCYIDPYGTKAKPNPKHLAALSHYNPIGGIASDKHGNIFCTINTGVISKIDKNNVFSLFGGKGLNYYKGEGGPALNAYLFAPEKINVDSKGNVYFIDGYSIRKIDTKGIISTVAGNLKLTYGFSGDNGKAVDAQLNYPSAITIDKNDNIYVADKGNNRIRKIDSAGIITTVVGSKGYGGKILENRPATESIISKPDCVAVDANGNIYFPGYGYPSCHIYKVDKNNILTCIAGENRANPDPHFTGEGGPALSALIGCANAITVDENGNIYFADYCRIRKISADGIYTTVAGTSQHGFGGDNGPALAAQFELITDITLDEHGDILVIDGGCRIRKISAANNEPVKSSCPVYEKMLETAQDLYMVANELEKYNTFYSAVVEEMIKRGYNSPYAALCLNIPAEDISESLKDEPTQRKFRSQFVEQIRAKADFRKKIAEAGISGSYDAKLFSKETVNEFCQLTPDKYSSDVWKAFWDAGYIDFDLYNKTKKLITLYNNRYYIIPAVFISVAAIAATVEYLSVETIAVEGEQIIITDRSVAELQSLKNGELPKLLIKKFSNILGKNFGKLGTVIENPNIGVKALDKGGHYLLSKISRGISSEDVIYTLKNPSIVLQQANNRYLYLSQKAAVVIDQIGTLITTYGEKDFDSQIIEILKDAGE